MKKIFFVIALTVFCIHAHAQNNTGGASTDASASNEVVTGTMSTKTDILAATTVSVSHNEVILSNLPANMPALKAVITDGDGQIIKSKKVGQGNNTIDVAHLSAGMYFVSLINRDKTLKGFVIHL